MYINKQTHPLSLDTLGHNILLSLWDTKSKNNLRGIDATCGNGHDTLFLAELMGDTGEIWAFDVQEQALSNTKERLSSHKTKINYIHAGHEHMQEYIHAPVHMVLFNLGYLPQSNKTIVTQSKTSLLAINQAQELLVQGGLMLIHCYTGHDAGLEESTSILQYTNKLDYKHWRVLNLNSANKVKNQEILIIIQKR